MGEENTSTRICIKNVPPSFDEAKLKYYLQSGQPSLKLTDCKLLKTKDGRSRKIAFVGFKTHDMAQTAVSYFDRSFALTSRLGVSFAFSKKDGKDDYRPWSKHSAGSSRNQQELVKEPNLRNEKTESDNKALEEESHAQSVDEPEHIRRKREEFLSAMGITTSKNKNEKSTVSKSKFWANDDAAPCSENVDDKMQQEQQISNGKNGADNNSDESSSSSSSLELDEVEVMKGEDKPKSDLDFLRSKQVEGDILSDDDSDDDDENDDSSSDNGSSDESLDVGLKKEAEVDACEHTADAILSSAERHEIGDRLFVRNLPFTTTEEELMEAFSQFGVVLSAHIPVDDMKKNKGYGFVTFQSKRDAKVAMERMDGEDFQGRLIHILPAKASTNQGESGSMNPASYKDQKALARQKEAENNTKSWQSSILRGDAVVDNLSNRLNVSKGDVLDVKDGISSGNAAVRLALGETHIIAENREFFLKYGVDLSEKDSVKRSKSTILVKNLPFDTSLEDLTKVFHGIGGDVPSQILLPPSKTAALVEYGHANDARRAFRRLAYTKFKHIPLYLEWAPLSDEANEQNEPTTGGHVVKDVVDKDLKSNALSNEAADEAVSQSIYIKNLNFLTSEEQLKNAFVKAGFQPHNVKIPMKAAPLKKSGSPGEPLSMGYGFVEFGSEEDALNAMKSLQGKLIDGHAVSIQLSAKNLSSKVNVSAESKSSSKNTKIMVRNVPFEATRSELLKLFGAFGQLKKVRLPKKIDGTHRGFAFCEFLTNKEAKNAMATLSGTHLYGRHLVLEWATPDGEDKMNVGVAREKAKRDAMKAGLGGGASGADKKKGRHTKF
jgi:multiple RNA-binding domain-containing protein 1